MYIYIYICLGHIHIRPSCGRDKRPSNVVWMLTCSRKWSTLVTKINERGEVRSPYIRMRIICGCTKLHCMTSVNLMDRLGLWSFRTKDVFLERKKFAEDKHATKTTKVGEYSATLEADFLGFVATSTGRCLPSHFVKHHSLPATGYDSASLGRVFAIEGTKNPSSTWNSHRIAAPTKGKEDADRV